jgi:hypothetical protein
VPSATEERLLSLLLKRATAERLWRPESLIR